MHQDSIYNRHLLQHCLFTPSFWYSIHKAESSQGKRKKKWGCVHITASYFYFFLMLYSFILFNCVRHTAALKHICGCSHSSMFKNVYRKIHKAFIHTVKKSYWYFNRFIHNTLKSQYITLKVYTHRIKKKNCTKMLYEHFFLPRELTFLKPSVPPKGFATKILNTQGS